MRFELHRLYRARALCIILIVGLLTYFDRLYHLDDALIYARYIRNALNGHGLVFNVGEPVNALTSILYAWLLYGASWLLHGKVLLAEYLLSALFFCVAALLAETIVPLAGILIAANSYFYFCSGMETSLFLVLLVLCIKAYLAGRVDWLPLLCTLAALTRFEGGVLAAVIAWRLWQQRRAPRLVAFAPVAVLVGLYLASNLWMYGAFLPQSAAAKFGQGMAGFWGRWPTAFLHFTPTIWLPIFGSWICVPILIVLVYLAARTGGMQSLNRVVLPFLIAVGLACILLNIPNYFWYYAPFLYFAYLYAAKLIPSTRSAQVIAVFLLACLVQISAVRLRQEARIDAAYVAAADWLSQNAAPNAVVATTETGTIGWFCDRPILDMVGLTTPQNATYTRHRDFGSWLKENPDYVIVHPLNPFPWENVAMASPNYTPAARFSYITVLRRK